MYIYPTTFAINFFHVFYLTKISMFTARLSLQFYFTVRPFATSYAGQFVVQKESPIRLINGFLYPNYDRYLCRFNSIIAQSQGTLPFRFHLSWCLYRHVGLISVSLNCRGHPGEGCPHDNG